jgi:hypothetical protein
MTRCMSTTNVLVEGVPVLRVQCDLEAEHAEPRRRIMHDFGGRSGYCHVCGTVRRRAPEFDCEPFPPTPHAFSITWRGFDSVTL